MISKEEVQRIAKLARLELTVEEAEKMQKDLSSILDYFSILKNKKAKSEKRDSHLTIRNVVREDTVQEKPKSLANNLIARAPDNKDGYIKVKQVL